MASAPARTFRGVGLGLLVVVAVVVIAVAVVVARQRRRQPLAAGRAPAGLGAGPAEPIASNAAADRALSGDVRALQPGDVVNHEGNDYVVERTVAFDEDGFTWHEHLLDDPVGGRAMWLGVEDDDGLEVTLWERVRGAALEPGPDELEHGGTTYRLDERGRARYSARTEAGPAESGDMEYADYVAGESLLAFERYGTGGWEVSTGSVVPEHSLDIYRR